MRKAKEYAQIYNDAKDKILALSKISGMIVQEAYDLKRSRNISTESGADSILRELDKKWKAMCKIINEDALSGGFERLSHELGIKEKLRG